MFEARIPDAPKDCVTCASCGHYGNGIRTIRTFQAVPFRGKLRRITAGMTEINLCRDCRMELALLFVEMDEYWQKEDERGKEKEKEAEEEVENHGNDTDRAEEAYEEPVR